MSQSCDQDITTHATFVEEMLSLGWRVDLISINLDLGESLIELYQDLNPVERIITLTIKDRSILVTKIKMNKRHQTQEDYWSEVMFPKLGGLGEGLCFLAEHLALAGTGYKDAYRVLMKFFKSLNDSPDIRAAMTNPDDVAVIRNALGLSLSTTSYRNHMVKPHDDEQLVRLAALGLMRWRWRTSSTLGGYWEVTRLGAELVLKPYEDLGFAFGYYSKLGELHV